MYGISVAAVKAAFVAYFKECVSNNDYAAEQEWDRMYPFLRKAIRHDRPGPVRQPTDKA